MFATMDIVDRVSHLEGDIVECGVLRGGHTLLAKLYARKRGWMRPRRYWLFDTFTGMPEPGEVDVKWDGEPASEIRERIGDGWCRCGLAEVENNFARFGMLDERVVFVPGLVEETLVGELLPEKIAYLRLDTDFYASTRIELEVLYPRLVPGGFLVIDDYGFWKGCQMAVDEFFGEPPKMLKIDRAARMMVKP